MPMTEAPAALPELDLRDIVLREAVNGLGVAPGEQKTLPPWLFYDQRGSELFEQITALPEYYLTRTEREIFRRHAQEIFQELGAPVTIVELGAGTATKTGLLLCAAVRRQREVLYQPIDVSPSALEEADAALSAKIPGVRILPQVANYITESYTIERLPGHRVLALYIGSSIGNFTPEEGTAILRRLRSQLQPGDALLLGVDLAPTDHKPVDLLVSAYDDEAGVTAAFNKNILARLNRELDANFDLDCFAHRACWNPVASRMEMHLESLAPQTIRIDGEAIDFREGETIHTENSYKFTEPALAALLASAGFRRQRQWCDDKAHFAVTLAIAE